MASRHGHSKSEVFLGFEDEEITTHFASYLCPTTNKVGGKPDWGENEQFPNPTCLLCGLTLPLIIQIYAPLEASKFHRTLYLFGCINPTCWNKKESWVCLRRQLLDTSVTESASHVKTLNSFDWCEGANDWVDYEMDNISENPDDKQDPILGSGNFINKMAELDVNERCVDDENIYSTSVVNQNFISSTATAELDDDHRDPVTVETLIPPQVDVASIYQQVKPVPKVPSDSLQFSSFFISVSEEEEEKTSDTTKHEFNGAIVNEQPNMVNQQNIAAVHYNTDESMEKYEKTLPAHGDKLFHHLISRIQKSPGQLLRYIRDSGTPLFLYPAEDVPLRCEHCTSDLVYELQLLPTLISRLQLHGSGLGHIEYGTVFILACKQSCWNSQDKVRSEHVLVQREL